MIKLKIGEKLPEFTYHSTPQCWRKRSFALAIRWGLLGFWLYGPFHLVEALHGPEWMRIVMVVAVFPMASALTWLLSQSGTRNNNAHRAVELLIAANDAIIASIGLIASKDQRERCSATYTLLLRSIFCEATGREFEVHLPGKIGTSPFYDPIKNALALDLRQAGIEGSVLGSNGPLHRLLDARAQMNTIVRIRIARGTYIAVIAFFLLSYVTIAIAMAGNASFMAGALFIGAFTYAITLLIVLAHQRSLPYRDGREDIRMGERFARIEEKNEAALRVS